MNQAGHSGYTLERPSAERERHTKNYGCELFLGWMIVRGKRYMLWEVLSTLKGLGGFIPGIVPNEIVLLPAPTPRALLPAKTLVA